MARRVFIWRPEDIDLAIKILGEHRRDQLQEAQAAIAAALGVEFGRSAIHNALHARDLQPPSYYLGRSLRGGAAPLGPHKPVVAGSTPASATNETHVREVFAVGTPGCGPGGAGSTPASHTPCDEHPGYFAKRPPLSTEKHPNGCADCWVYFHGVAKRCPPMTPSQERDVSGALAKLLHIVRGDEPVALEELCDTLDLPPAKARELIVEARAKGYDVRLEHDIVGRSPPPDPSAEVVVNLPDAVVSKRAIALVGDVHVGSKQFLEGPFRDFCDEAYERGVRTFVQVGDLLDGVYRFSIWEQRERGFEEQIKRAVEVVPQYADARWLWILGNHDETFERDSGLSVMNAANQEFQAAGRTDVECVGSRGAYVRLVGPGERRGLIVEAWHPKGQPAYALSYKMQNHIRDYRVGMKPDILAVGHWHQQCYFETRGVHAFSCGTWQGGKSSFGKSIGGSPSIGSWIVEYGLTETETLRDVRPTWRAYYEFEEPRRVEMS